MEYKTNKNQQLSLFEPSATYKFKKPSLKAEYKMSEEYLESWKKRIYNYQQEAKKKQEKQINLLTAENNISWDTDSFDPFSIPTHTDQFYNLPKYNGSESCLYFILDTELPLLLYVGETKLSPYQRWINHDCKSYIQKYIELHRQYKLNTNVRSAFWWGISPERHIRQRLERDLILKWRSPFNKESWQHWGQPFK
ncbi:MAG: hypothetical protein ACXITR_03145 [Cyanobacterium sp.]